MAFDLLARVIDEASRSNLGRAVASARWQRAVFYRSTAGQGDRAHADLMWLVNHEQESIRDGPYGVEAKRLLREGGDVTELRTTLEAIGGAGGGDNGTHWCTW